MKTESNLIERNKICSPRGIEPGILFRNHIACLLCHFVEIQGACLHVFYSQGSCSRNTIRHLVLTLLSHCVPRSINNYNNNYV